MTADERGWCICQLVPGAKYQGSWTNGMVVWTDERPLPTDEAVQAYYETWQAEEAKAETIKNAHAVYYAALEAGYTDSVGIVWYCNERATMDLAMMVVLNTLDETEPVYILSMSDGIKSMTYVQFKALAVEVGRHAYELRQTLWTTILNA